MDHSARPSYSGPMTRSASRFYKMQAPPPRGLASTLPLPEVRELQPSSSVPPAGSSRTVLFEGQPPRVSTPVSDEDLSLLLSSTSVAMPPYSGTNRVSPRVAVCTTVDTLFSPKMVPTLQGFVQPTNTRSTMSLAYDQVIQGACNTSSSDYQPPLDLMSQDIPMWRCQDLEQGFHPEMPVSVSKAGGTPLTSRSHGHVYANVYVPHLPAPPRPPGMPVCTLGEANNSCNGFIKGLSGTTRPPICSQRNQLNIDQQKCTEALTYDMLATDLAYYLVRKGVPFREAHHIAGQVVATSEAREVDLCDLTLQELKTISEHFDEDVTKVWNYENSVEQYHAFGGTAKESVLGQIQLLDEWLSTSIKIPQFQFQSKLG